jgi:hypothetical protein
VSGTQGGLYNVLINSPYSEVCLENTLLVLMYTDPDETPQII